MSPRKPIARRSRSAPSRREHRAFFRPAAVPGTEVLVARRSPLPSHVYHERYVVCFRQGSADGVWLLQPDEVHVDHGSKRSVNFNMLFIEPALVAKAAQARGMPQALRFRTSRSSHAPLFTAAYDFCAAVAERAHGQVQQARFAACLRYMLDFMERAPPEPHPCPGGVQGAVARAKDRLRGRFNEAVTLDELVEVSGLSRFHLLRCFADRVGLTPHAYQIRLRVERAMALLHQGSRPGEVAGLVGFADQSHLTRHFRRVLRVTPGEYAQAWDERR